VTDGVGDAVADLHDGVEPSRKFEPSGAVLMRQGCSVAGKNMLCEALSATTVSRERNFCVTLHLCAGMRRRAEDAPIPVDFHAVGRVFRSENHWCSGGAV
jgi:hypothetical protein